MSVASLWLSPEENSPFGGAGVSNKLLSNSVFARVISALLILQPSPVFAVEIQLQLHAGLDFTDCGERARCFMVVAQVTALHTICFQFARSCIAGNGEKKNSAFLINLLVCMIKVVFTKTKCCCCSVSTLQLCSQMWKCDESAMVTWQWLEGWGLIGSMNRCWLIDRCLVLIILLASFLLAELREVRLLPWAPMSFLLPLNSSSCFSKRILFFSPEENRLHTLCLRIYARFCSVFFTWSKAIKSLNIDRAGLSSQPNVQKSFHCTPEAHVGNT